MGMTASRRQLLVNGSDQQLRHVIQDALGFSVRLHELRNGLGQAAGLTGPCFSILAAIEHLSRQGSVGVNQLGDHLHWSGTFVTTELNKLVASGLAAKVAHPADGRRVLVSLTSGGQHLLDGMGSLQRSVNDAIFGSLSAEEFTGLAKTMRKLVGGAEDALAILRLNARRGQEKTA